jgi:hypothetical protein
VLEGIDAGGEVRVRADGGVGVAVPLSVGQRLRLMCGRRGIAMRRSLRRRRWLLGLGHGGEGSEEREEVFHEDDGGL